MTGKIFISYRREDSAGYARALFERLERSFPKQVFMDVEGVELGMDFVEAIEKTLRFCKIALVIIGKDWLTITDSLGNRRLDDRHDFVRLEVATALKRGIRVVPVLVEGAEMPKEKLPAGLGSLTRRQALRLSDDAWENSVGQLVSELTKLLGDTAKRESESVSEKAPEADDQKSRLRQKFQPLPQPFHLPLEEIIGQKEIEGLVKVGQMVLHTAGNTGGAMGPVMQGRVARAMVEQANASNGHRPTFFYHLGNVVFFYGGAEYYYSQFYEPYAHYPAPIFAIPGNHDGDVNPKSPARSLQGFVRNFCAASPKLTPEAGGLLRTAMTQPNVFWTLDTPFATCVGLYTNVPEGGMLDENQKTWLATELSHAPGDRALIVAMHHPIYSLSSRFSSSGYLEGVLEAAAQAAGRYPDLVLASHAMNYQRFTRRLGERQIPYLVVGAGGYPRLHSLRMRPSGKPLNTPTPMPGKSGVMLESYCDDRHGFMRMTVNPTEVAGEYFVVTQRGEPVRAERFDSFSLDLRLHRVR